MISSAYRAQADLLLQVLPYVAKEDVFALKGGTAINLFVRDMPRLSVDIDLTYLPFDDRATALKNISTALQRIAKNIASSSLGVKTSMKAQTGGEETKVICHSQAAQIKIEANTIIRGHVFSPRIMDVSKTVETEFGKFVTMNVVSNAELFGGKICAALDRQHPRDMFDIYHMLKNEGFTDEIRLGFLTMLISHSSPIHEMISPNFQDQQSVFDNQFAGMTLTPFTYADYEATRKKLVQEINRKLTKNDRLFLLSFKKGEPDWGLVALENLSRMPAVQWKLSNIQKLKYKNSSKHAEQFKFLEKKLS